MIPQITWPEGSKAPPKNWNILKNIKKKLHDKAILDSTLAAYI